MKRGGNDDDVLTNWLVAMERRRRAWMLFSAVARALSVVAITTLGLVAIDHRFALSAAVRWGAEGVIVVAMFGFIAKAMSVIFRRINLVASAVAIEKFRPGLDERLITFASRTNRIDPRVLTRVQDEITSALAAHPLPVAWRRRHSMWVAVVAAALSAGLLIAGHHRTWAISETRILRPWANTPAPFAAALTLSKTATVFNHGDMTVTFDARVLHSPQDETVVLHVVDRAGENSIVMTPQGQNRFTRTLSRLLQNVDVYATTSELRSRAVHLSLNANPTTRPRGGT